MFENLSERLQKVVSNIKSKGVINEDNISEIVREIRLCLLEADVNVKIVKEFIDNVKENRTNEDLVYEIMLKYGIDLTLPIEEHDNIYSIGFGALVVCLDDNITKEIANDIIDLTKDSSTSRVVFKDSGFKSDADKTNIKEILKTNHIDEFITI